MPLYICECLPYVLIWPKQSAVSIPILPIAYAMSYIFLQTRLELECERNVREELELQQSLSAQLRGELQSYEVRWIGLHAVVKGCRALARSSSQSSVKKRTTKSRQGQVPAADDCFKPPFCPEAANIRIRALRRERDEAILCGAPVTLCSTAVEASRALTERREGNQKLQVLFEAG